MRFVEEAGEKTLFLVALMRKYADPNWSRPKAFFPRFDEIDVYAMTIERLTGKQQVLPELSQRWPALDRTKSPNATAPREDSQAQ